MRNCNQETITAKIFDGRLGNKLKILDITDCSREIITAAYNTYGVEENKTYVLRHKQLGGYKRRTRTKKFRSRTASRKHRKG